jgi:HemY protein
MRAAFWLLALFGIAVAAALVAGNNQAVVTLFWPPHRVDLSFNLVVLLLAGFFLVLHLALRALAAAFSLPLEARRWRAQQKERAMFGAMLDALAHQLAGRYIRATKSAQNALAQERSLSQVADQHEGEATHNLGRSTQLRSLAHLLVAESAQSLQNRPLREEHLQRAVKNSARGPAMEVREAVHFRAARWALDDQDASAAIDWLAQLPQGAARRTLALRLKLRALRQLRRTAEALETARLLAKHRAFSVEAAASIVRGLALELLGDAHDPAQLQRAWDSLDANEKAMPELVVQAASRLMKLGGDAELARAWLLTVWDTVMEPKSQIGDNLRVKMIGVLEPGLDSLDSDWLARIEAAQFGRPRDGNLHYLAGMACLSRQLWGKARQLLTQATQSLQDPTLLRNAWRALALLAEQRADAPAAEQAYKQAASV